MKKRSCSGWERCDTLVKTWLVASMLKQISKSVKNCKTSSEVWLDLQERFLQTNTVKLFNIEKALHDCKQGLDSVNTFYTKLKSLWDDRDVLCNVAPCGCGLDEFIKNQKTMKFLMGLNENSLFSEALS
ncbi:hypothetical protein ACLB2K_019155 [Fragaria x ananassa]